MGTITTSVGLISGLNHETLVKQLIAIEARPRDQLLTRISGVDAQKTAYLDVSARISALLSRISVLSRTGSFQTNVVTSSKPELLSATAGSGVRAGAYQFSVRALAAAHQLVSRGFESRTATLNPGTLTIESAQARVDRDTRLGDLNGGAGVQRGAFKLLNAAGQEAVINIADALTLNEVVTRINGAGINVRASLADGALLLTDSSTGAGRLEVQEIAGGRTAADLGFDATRTVDSDQDGRLTGSALAYMAAGTSLAALNDGLGIRISRGGHDVQVSVGGVDIGLDLSTILKPDTRLERLNRGAGVRLGRIEITARDGTKAEVDLTGAKTIQDVEQRIEAAFGGGRISVILSDNRLVVTDGTTVPTGQTATTLAIKDLSGNAALDLGLAVTGVDNKISGGGILSLDRVADVIAAINFAPGNAAADGTRLVTAEIGADGRNFVLRAAAGAGDLTISSTQPALADLGLTAGTYADAGSGATAQGGRLIAAPGTVLLKTLRGGAGLDLGTVRLSNGAASVDVDLAGATTLAEVVDRVNTAATDANLGVTLGYDATGARLLLAGAAGTSGAVSLTDLSGSFAAQTGLTQSGATVTGANLQRRYISETTPVTALSNGRGLTFGTIKFTNSSGVFKTLTLNESTTKTLQNVIDAINDLDVGVQARINDNGDGLLITDSAGGAGPLKIEDQSGSAARSLNLLGSSAAGSIDGSFEFKLEVGAGETLEALARRISQTTTLAEATLLNDGAGATPYRLSLSSRVGGAAGELIVDGGTTGFGLTTLTAAQDARVLFGGTGASGVLLTSSSNTFRGVIDGLDITVNGASDAPITVKIDQNQSTALEALRGFVTDYNAALARIKEVSGYNQATEKKGVLLGEAALRSAESRLSRMLSRVLVVPGSAVRRLSEIGLRASGKGELTFDETAFNQAYAADPEGVTKFFTDVTAGAGPMLKTEIEKITGTAGVIQSRTQALADNRNLLQQRVDRLNELLDRKQARLLRQFQAMETALASLQTQQASLADFMAQLTA